VITTIARPKTLRIAGFAAGAAAIAGAAVYMTASAAGINLGFGPKNTSSANAPVASTVDARTGGSASSVCNEFVSHFASDLGVSQDKVNSAFQEAVGQTLADEVKAGDITQAQADAIKQRLAGKAPCAIAGSLGAGKNPAGGAYTQALMSAAASALGITPDQLKADLAKGMTLHQIADAQNPPVTEDQFRSRLIANLKPLLDKAVADGKLTSAQEQQIIQRLQTGPILFWDTPVKAPAAATTPGA
jgi:hypothetical protein